MQDGIQHDAAFFQDSELLLQMSSKKRGVSHLIGSAVRHTPCQARRRYSSWSQPLLAAGQLGDAGRFHFFARGFSREIGLMCMPCSCENKSHVQPKAKLQAPALRHKLPMQRKRKTKISKMNRSRCTRHSLVAASLPSLLSSLADWTWFCQLRMCLRGAQSSA